MYLLFISSLSKWNKKTCSFTGHLRVLLSSAEHDSSRLKDLSGFQLHYRLMNEKTGPKILHKYSFTMPSLALPASFVRDTDGAEPQLGSVSRRPLASAGRPTVCSSSAHTVFHQRDLSKRRPKAEGKRPFHSSCSDGASSSKHWQKQPSNTLRAVSSRERPATSTS